MESVSDTSETQECNTIGKFRSFFFTWNNPPAQCDTMLQTHLTHWKYQPEIGSTNGTYHLQGIGYFKNARSLEQIQKLFPGIHIEKIASWFAANKYVCKLETSAGPVRDSKVNTNIEDPLTTLAPYKWEVYAEWMYLTKPDNRTIYWGYGTPHHGKSVWARHMCLKYKDILYVNGSAVHIEFAITKWLEAKHPLKMIIYYIVMSDTFDPKALEVIKDGIFFSPKYESGMCIFNYVHLLVLSNFPPECTKMSTLAADRWKIFNIDLYLDLFTPLSDKEKDII